MTSTPMPPLTPADRRLHKALTVVLCAQAGVGVLMALGCWLVYPWAMHSGGASWLSKFAPARIPIFVTVLSFAAPAMAALLGVTAWQVRKLRPRALRLIKIASAAVLVVTIAHFYAAIQAVNIIREDGLQIGEWMATFGDGYLLKAVFGLPDIAAASAAIWMLFRTLKPQAVLLLGGVPRQRVESRFGGDKFLRKTVVLSFIFHFLALIVLPWMFQGGGCVDPYRIPGGGGGGGLQQPEIVKIKAKKKPQAKRKTYTLRMNSAISFYVPNIDESDVGKDVEKVTENTYQATGAGQLAGKGTGKGKGKGFGKGNGRGGGWGGGGDGLVRFIRLQHGGAGWDDGMDNATRSDLNFLEALRDESGKDGAEPFKIANKTEAIPPRTLKEWRKGQAPPFVYITGSGPIGGISAADIKIIRQYCLDGGMIFGDAGGGQFDASFRSLMAQIFPDHPLVDIPNDDAIFGGGDSGLQAPFLFPNGAPPLWHHGGYRALGVKDDQGHWMVFYHPGDMKDAWKTGHYGVSKEVSAQAFRIGMNVLYYAFTYYSERYNPGK